MIFHLLSLFSHVQGLFPTDRRILLDLMPPVLRDRSAKKPPEPTKPYQRPPARRVASARHAPPRRKIPEPKATSRVQFDPAAKLPPALQERMNYLCIGGPKHQHQVYGPLSAYLQGYKYPATHFLVKPQALLREECSDTVEPLRGEDGKWSNFV